MIIPNAYETNIKRFFFFYMHPVMLVYTCNRKHDSYYFFLKFQMKNYSKISTNLVSFSMGQSHNTYPSPFCTLLDTFANLAVHDAQAIWQSKRHKNRERCRQILLHWVVRLFFVIMISTIHKIPILQEMHTTWKTPRPSHQPVTY
jgi:hypothetical protein